MSDSNTSGSGATSAIPGWYTDPYNATQLRWWDGTQWTDHVAPAAATAEPAAAEQPAAEQVAAEPVVAESAPIEQTVTEPTVAETPATEVPVATPAEEAPAEAAEVFTPAVDPAPLPSRRALREAAGGATSAIPIIEASTPAAATPADPVTAATQEPVAAVPLTPEPITPEQETSDLAPAVPANAFAEAFQEPATPAEPTLAEAATAEPVAATGSEPAAEEPLPWGPPPASQPAWEQPAAAVPGAVTIESLMASQNPSAGEVPMPTATPSVESAPVADTPAVQDTTAAAVPTTVPSEWDLRPREKSAEAQAAISSSTVWAWLLAILPVLAAGAIGYELLVGGASGSNLLLIAVIAASYLLGIVFAVADRSRLDILGLPPTSWVWAALTAPVYLIVRAVTVARAGSNGWPPAIVCIAAVVVGAGGLVLWNVVSGNALF